MSTLKTNTIQAATGSNVSVASGTVLQAPGHVLQVKYYQLTTMVNETYGTANTNQAITNFTVNITPSSTSSIIKLEANIMYENMLDKTTKSLEKIIKNTETSSSIQ